MERTLIIFKPDAMNRMLVGRILTRFEEKGLRIVGLKLQQSSRAQVEQHYAVHKQRPFYASLVEFMTAGPVILAVLEGPGAIAVVRSMLGATNGREAAPGTIRGDFGLDQRYNLVHASDGPDTARRDRPVLQAGRVGDYTRADRWIASE